MIIEQAFFSLPEIFFGSGYKYKDDNLLEAGIVSAFSLSLLQELNGRNIQNPINAIKSESSYISSTASNQDENEDPKHLERVDLFIDLKNVNHNQNGYGFKSTNYIEAKYFKQIIGNDTNHAVNIIIDLYRLMLLTPKDKDVGRYFLHTYAGDPKFFIANKYHWLLSLIKPGKHNITINLSYDDLAKKCPKIDINLTVTNYTIVNDKHSENFYFTLSKIENFHIITTDIDSNNNITYRFFTDRIVKLQNFNMVNTVDNTIGDEEFHKCFEFANNMLREYLDNNNYESHIEEIRVRVGDMIKNNSALINILNDNNIKQEFYKIKLKLEQDIKNKKQKDEHKYKEYSNDILNILDNREIIDLINEIILANTNEDDSIYLKKIGYENILEILFQNLFDNLLLNLDNQYPNINKLIQSKNGGKKLFCTNLLKHIRNKLYTDFTDSFSKYIKDKIISDTYIKSIVEEILNEHKAHKLKLKKYYLIKNEELAKYIEKLYCLYINDYLNHEFKFLYLINFNQSNLFDFSFFEEIVYEEIINIAKNIPNKLNRGV